jgi:hypothetical protein
MAINFSISIPSHLVSWLEEYAESHALYTHDRPSVGKAAARKLEELYNQEMKGGTT